MADGVLASRSAMAGLLSPGRRGRMDGPAGVTVAEHPNLRMASLMARRGKADELASLIRGAYGLDIPTRPRRVGDDRLAFLWAGPEQWLVVAEGAAQPLEEELRGHAGDLASVAGQGDGRAVLRVGGPRARDVLATGMTIDLHPRAFRAGDTALTLAAHVGVQIWQVDDRPTYDMAIPRSYAGSLLSWLLAAGEAYGIQAHGPPSAGPGVTG